MKLNNEEESCDFSIMALCITISLLIVFFIIRCKNGVNGQGILLN